MSKNFRLDTPQMGVGEELVTSVWYRSPLWASDHLMGADGDFREHELAWCGRPLGAARDWEVEEAGLWQSQRVSGKCSHCDRRQKEWGQADGLG